MTPQEINKLETWLKTIRAINNTHSETLNDMYVSARGSSVFIKLGDIAWGIDRMIRESNKKQTLESIDREKYLFRVVETTLKYLGLEADREEISDLVMTELLNIK